MVNRTLIAGLVTLTGLPVGPITPCAHDITGIRHAVAGFILRETEIH